MTKKLMTSFGLMLIFFFVGCKEKKEGVAQATYRIGSNGLLQVLNGPLTKTSTGTVHSVSVSEGSSTVAIFFAADPVTTTAGTWYKIASQQKASLNQLLANECSFQISSGANDVYLSLNSSDSIWVGLSDGKFKATYPWTNLEHRQVSTAQIIDTVVGGIGYIME